MAIQDIFKGILSAPEKLGRAVHPSAWAAYDTATTQKADQRQLLLDAVKEVKAAKTPEERQAALARNQAILSIESLFNETPYQKRSGNLAADKFAEEQVQNILSGVGGIETPVGRTLTATTYGITDPDRLKKDLLPSQQIQQKVLDAIESGGLSGNTEMLRALGGGSNITNILGGKQMTEGQIQRVATKQAFLDIGKEIMDRWDKSYTGPIQGRVSRIKHALGGGTKNQAKFVSGVTSMLETMYQRAGKQLSDTEIDKWKPYLPDINSPDIVFEGVMENVIDNVATYLEKEVSLAGQQGYRTTGALSEISPTKGAEKPISEMSDEELRKILEE